MGFFSLADVRTHLRAALLAPARVEAMLHSVQRLAERPPYVVNIPPPPAFVLMLVEGHALFEHPRPPPFEGRSDAWRPAEPTGETRPVFLGAAVTLGGKTSEVLHVRPERPLGHGRVIVFADLARVAVRGIFLGTDLLQGDIGNLEGNAPTATFRTCQPGVMIRAHVELRPDR